MDVEISERTKNPLLGREELLLAVEETKETPSRKDLRKKIAALAGANEELVMVGKIEHHFGSKKLSCKARIYESKEKMDSVEAKFIVKRNLGVKKKDGNAKEEEKKE
ncbi:MAG: 30S ribosomal protein S24e [Candidatus Diapherotrites archaeon]